jgi:hypothetical protein
MADKKYPQSGLPIRKTVELLPSVFRSDTNDKFMSAVVDPLVQPGVLEKTVGYIGRRYGKTYTGTDVYLDSDETLRSRYQLEPGVVVKSDSGKVENFYDFIDFKNQLKFFGNTDDRDNLITSQDHYSWNPPKHCDKYVNFLECYWIPEGPPPVDVYGQPRVVGSQYGVSLGTESSFILTPDGYTNNPTLTFYRGQTYKFRVNCPKEGFVIRTNYDTGSLTYNTNKAYSVGQYAVYDGKLWKALVPILQGDGSTISTENSDWEYVENISTGTALDYNIGVTNNGIENGFITFTVPFDAPDVLFYQGKITPDRFGRIMIANIESNTFVDVDKEIYGKETYTSGNGVKFTTGLIVQFKGNVTPSKYATGRWVVENVGVRINLVNWDDLIIPRLSKTVPEVVFDNAGFDTEPFDDAANYPTDQDYIVISRDSQDRNAWARYNRWFHRQVLEYAHNLRGEDFTAPESARAKRPIFEFLPGIHLFNHGTIAKDTVDYIDNFTTDVFSTIEGSTGYIIDGETIFEGSRILFVADADSLTNNKIYKVEFITHNGKQQIHLAETADTDSKKGECVLIRRGTKNGGVMFHYDGTAWVRSQEKTKVNQPPLFDVFDENGISFSDPETYPESTFAGTEIAGYKVGVGAADSKLGFPLSYLNINNIGDMLFHFNWDSDTFRYQSSIGSTITRRVATGFYFLEASGGYGGWGNGWTPTSTKYLMPLLDSVKITETTNVITLTTIDWTKVASDTDYEIRFYINGTIYTGPHTRNINKFTFSQKTFVAGDIVSLKLVTTLDPDTGYYEIPLGLEKNPLNAPVIEWTLGQAADHLNSGLDFNKFWTGVVPGLNDLRDIPLDEFGQPWNTYSTRYMHHSGIAPVAVGMLCDKTNNVIKAIQHSKKSYTNFKNSFLDRATTLSYNNSIADFVDDIIADLAKTKTSSNAFSDSDMIGSGAYTSIKYVVEDTGINTFALSTPFSLTEISRRAVYVYLNGSQLLNSKEYSFNSTFSFTVINKTLSLNDTIEIREYVSTASCFIPATPTSLGLYKKYTPMKFIDDTYLEPKEVIQGHDGSITIAYGDYRDDLLLELEYRIYNNIKQQYNAALFDIDEVIASYYGNGVYTKAQLDDIVNQEFLKWIQNTNISYAENKYFDSENSFTYNYSNMTDPSGTQNLPGYWRGVYKWFYDTDRPHRCPWEMLGFSEQPTWWEEQYGAAPYTSNNLLLWEDLRDGVIRQGSQAGIYERYKRPTLMGHIPVDGDGKLLSPLDSNLAGEFVLINSQGTFSLGDVAPVEYAWRSSSEWPFAVITAMCLMRPFDFISDSFDRSRVKLNKIGQTVHTSTDLFITLDDIVIPEDGGAQTSGLVNYLVDYAKSIGISVDEVSRKIKNIDVQLSTRLSGFVDKGQQKYLLDSKSPKSASSSIFVPPENYDIIFNVSTPIASVAYSGVILEKVNGGWVITGYDDVHPYFNYYEPSPEQKGPTISVGGVSETFVSWQSNKLFSNGQICRHDNMFYRALKTHTSTNVFDETLWKKLAKLPLVGAVEALRRRKFNLGVKRLTYGTKLITIQEVVDFLLGYEQYLKSQGFKFDRYDSENQTAQDWTTSCKEFMFWTRHNWAIGSLITLSPAAQKLDITIPVGVADNILDGFYSYQVLKDDGKPLTPNLINVNRSFQNITIETVNTEEGMYYLKLYYVLKEHVTLFDDRTVFNDVIYDKPTGYRQERIKSQGFRTVDWDGDYTSPGFLFDNVNIQAWEPFTDYRLGDIVSYRSYNWTSLVNQLGTEEFNDANWTKLDSTPEKQLVANFDYKINQFEDYYDATSSGIGDSQRALARHAVGYQTREYLENLSEDPVTQFQLYQGFIREKGTSNAITKVFNKLSRSGDSSVVLNEEWAFRVGRLGGLAQLKEIELSIDKDKLLLNPQPILLVEAMLNNPTDQYYRLTRADFVIEPIPFTKEINPVSVDAEPIRTAGYVRSDQPEFILSSKDEILSVDINTVVENDHFWITFNNYEWDVIRFNQSPLLIITDAVKTDTSVLVTLNRRHDILVGDIVGIKNIENLTGFYKVIAVDLIAITVEVPVAAQNPIIDDSTVLNIHLFESARFGTYADLDFEKAALLKNESKLFVDNTGNDRWEVIQKQQQFFDKKINEYGITTPLYTGSKVLYVDNLKQTIVSIPGSGYVMTYVENSTELLLKQIVAPQQGFESLAVGSFGKAMAVSPDNRWLVVGSPAASNVPSNYKGVFNPSATYLTDDIVIYAGKLWKAVNTVTGDGSSINVLTSDWVPATSIPTSTSGVGLGYTNQGMITVYEWINQQWTNRYSFVSPRPEVDESFGAEIAIGQDGNTYYMAVSATKSVDGRGRVYLYTFSGTEWQHFENQNYKGIYDPISTAYYAGEIVWYDSALWRCLEDSTYGDGSTISVESSGWQRIDPISTQSSLPTNVSIEDDGSTLTNLTETGILSSSQLAELIKAGDNFGTSVAMNRDASILVIGTPYSDGQYFSNFRGTWRPDIEYIEGDVVKYQNSYHKLVQRAGESIDSTTRSYNEEPDGGSPWDSVGDSTGEASGKVFVYQRSQYGVYELKQTITTESMSLINDVESGTSPIATGDQFGWSVDMDYTGTTLVVTSPKADLNFQNQGSAYVFRTDGFAGLEYRLKQKLESFEKYPNEFFGQNISISADSGRIAVGAKNSPFIVSTRFDLTQGTTFDQGRTRFVDVKGFAGAVYVFEKKADSYFLTEKLETELSPYESFGYSVDCTQSVIAVGSPDYIPPAVVGSAFVYEGSRVGTVRVFRKDPAVNSWNTLTSQEPVVDISTIKSIALYDTVNNIKIQDIDYVDHAKLKILNSAEQEIKFKTLYDPAIYSVGTDDQVVDTSSAWAGKYVGMLWWDLSTAKWNYYEQGDVSYRVGNWNQLAAGASIDVYEWVETNLLPNEWAALADTNDGLAAGISGQPLYPDNTVYSIKELTNPFTGLPTGTLYYYWVKNKAIVPNNMPSRRISASEVASLINNPSGSGTAFISLIASDKFLAYNFEAVMNSDTAVINIQYLKNKKQLNRIHNEYQLLTEGVADSLPTDRLEAKWIDSLVGSDIVGNKVPDSNLPAKQKYGLDFRPKQSMFINNIAILKDVVLNINAIFAKEAFADNISFRNLGLIDEPPINALNLYDVTVDTEINLQTVGIARIRPAVLQANIIDGEIDTIDVVSAGFGYRVAPPIEFEGDGSGAKASAELDNQGRIVSVTVLLRGKKYSTAIAKVRNFSVLVRADSTLSGFWGIYAWDDVRKVFFRTRSQAYNTTKYWSLVDWWKSGYTITSRIVKEIGSVYEEPTISTSVGDLIRVKEYASGGWAVFEKISETASTFSDNYTMVGRYEGTIEISSAFYESTITGTGYDNTITFDKTNYDLDASKELRNILRAVKEDLCIGDYAVEWNKLFFVCIRYAFAEQQYIDWAFKTSFLNATHNVGALEQRLNYKNDNLVSFQSYIDEVKPYKTTVREYVSRYDTTLTSASAVADFDLPPVYSETDGKIIPTTISNENIQSYPWKWWLDNQGYSVTSIEVYEAGTGYSAVPTVRIEGTGTGATARAYISNGTVSGIVVLTPGSGYTTSPTITLVGGNDSGSVQARATAILGGSPVRTFNLGIKFDRLSKTGLYSTYSQTQTFTASGLTSVFELNYACTRDKSKITIYKDGELILNDQYTINLYTSSVDTYSLLKGKLIFTAVPAAGSTIVVEYEKNDALLDAVNRIDKLYSPIVGMRSKDLNQLMTGVDFGGVQIQGTTFDVTGGWDALPWFTDNWDSVEAAADYYVVCDGSTTTVTLPFVPALGQEITIYLKRAGIATPRTIDTLGASTAPTVVLTPAASAPPAIRIDSPYYVPMNDSSTSVNPNAEMPTFIGDGVNKVVEIGRYIQTNSGDILIFRPVESDGSVTITDDNLLDTKFSGGSFSATGSTGTKTAPNAIDGIYAIATGTLAEEISIDGDKFISPDQVPAPEENMPGQVLDSLSIKVFNNTRTGAAPLQSKTLIANGTTKIYDIDLEILESNSVLVYVDKIKKEYNGSTLTTGFIIDFVNNQIEFASAPASGATIEIIAIGIGGVTLLDYQEFIADGTTSLFLTAANYSDTSSILVTVNGQRQDVGFTNSTGIVTTKGKTLVQFGAKPNFRDIVKIICVGSTSDVDSSLLPIVRVNRQALQFEGSTRSFDLDTFVNLARGSSKSSMVVELNGEALRGVDTVYKTYEGVGTYSGVDSTILNNNQVVLGVDPLEPSGAILTQNIKVFINGEIQTVIQDYIYNGTTKVVTINYDLLTEGDIIKIENDFRAEYSIVNNNLVIDSSVAMVYDDIINITWFSEYPSMGILSDEYVGGKVNYFLPQTPLAASYVWVYKNGVRLTKDRDYYISLPRGVLYLTAESTVTDLIKIMMFGSDIYKLPSAYEIHKDMLNIYHFKRYSVGSVKLSKELNYYDQEITVTDGSELGDPIPSRNIPGAIIINGERIEYNKKTGNVLSNLRRGSFGTGIATVHVVGSDVADIGPQESIPYNETQDRQDFVSDGSSLLIGPLDFVPTLATRSSWYTDTIPISHGPCDQIEVFAAGRRLRKDPISVYDENLGASSPAADTQIEAEFAVDGAANYIRLTTAVPAGTRISVIRRTGKVWYDRGETTASAGESLLKNTTPMAEFIAARTTKLPE